MHLYLNYISASPPSIMSLLLLHLHSRSHYCAQKPRQVPSESTKVGGWSSKHCCIEGEQWPSNQIELALPLCKESTLHQTKSLLSHLDSLEPSISTSFVQRRLFQQLHALNQLLFHSGFWNSFVDIKLLHHGIPPYLFFDYFIIAGRFCHTNYNTPSA